MAPAGDRAAWFRRRRGLGLAAALVLVATPALAVDVAGTVADGSGAGWPLWARVTWTPTLAGPPLVAYTDPATGAYQLGPVAVGTEYQILVEGVTPGYRPETLTVTAPPAGAVDQDFALEVDAGACTAPAYADAVTSLLSEDFSGGIPASWTVVDNSSPCALALDVWSTTDLAPLWPSFSTVVTPPFAVINSNLCGAGTVHSLDTDLVTPALDLSELVDANDALSITFHSDYRDLCGPAADSVSLDVWNGSAWVTVFDFCGKNTRRNRLESFSTQAANGVADARVRFHYDSGWDWWWAIDDVEITASACLYQGGGLLWGAVTDANTGDPVVGATVTVDGHTVTTVLSADPAVAGGVYFAAAGPGLQDVTVTAPGYGTVHTSADLSAGGGVRLDVQLPAGLLALNPDPVTVRVALFSTAAVNAAIGNTGGAAAGWSLLEVDAPAPPPALVAGPIQTVPPRVVDDKARMFSPTARVLPERPARTDFPTASTVPAGDVTAAFDSGLPGGPYGNAVRDTPSPVPTRPVEVWLGNLASLAGDDEIRQYTSDGVDILAAAGTVVAPPPGAVFWADATFNPRTGSFRQVNVGGDNCIHEFTGTGFTGTAICPPFTTSQRGLAYDPLTDTYYSGSFNDGAIVQLTPAGTILRRVFKDVDVAGLAFNPVSGHLFALQNTNSPEPDIVVMDASTPTFDVLRAFDIVQDGVSVMGDFEQGGLDLDCQGRLWADNFVTGKVYVATSGETAACHDVPWLTVSQTAGTTTADGSTPVSLGFDAGRARPGYHPAYLLLDDDTPYGTQNVPIHFTAAFLDVAPGGFDRFVHGLAGAGITAGCGAGNFCPEGMVTRGLLPVWLLLARNGPDYRPPAATGVLFADVPAESFGADFVEQFYRLGITAGCATNPLRYCPSTPVTRAQMSVFLLRTLEGPGYTPPPATGLFADVPAANPLAPWIEEIFHRGITAGCGTAPLRFCPSGNVSRGQMAVFVTRTFGLPVAP
jgi:hypothetical protein